MVVGGWYPTSVGLAIGLLVVNMLAWGSWSNTLKGIGKWRFEAYYLTYSFGLLLMGIIFFFTLGMISSGGVNSLDVLEKASGFNVSYALTAGIVWNAGNILLVAAIVLAGFSVAFPIGIGLSLVIGSILSYVVAPHGIAWLEFTGLGVVLAAIILNAFSYRIKDKASKVAENKKVSSNFKRGIILSVTLGVLIGGFDPLFAMSIEGNHPLNSYGALLFLTVGVIISSLIMVPIFMHKPLIPGDQKTSLKEWYGGKARYHGFALVGAVVWTLGTLINFISAPVAGVTISYILGQNATMVAAVWGIFAWKELKGAPRTSWILVGLMFVLFIVGIVLVAMATA
ncbi:MAG: GRP family sugar transporter [Nitrososphaerota archaeon]